MIAVLVFGISIPVVAASWRTGCFPSNGKNTSAITVSLTNKNKDAYIKIHTYTAKNRAEALKSNPATKERSCSVHVTMRDNNGKWIWEGDISSGSWGKKMKLGNCIYDTIRLYTVGMLDIIALSIGALNVSRTARSNKHYPTLCRII